MGSTDIITILMYGKMCRVGVDESETFGVIFFVGNLPLLMIYVTVENHLMFSFRDIQDHTAMISLMDRIQQKKDEGNAAQCLQPDFMYWYCFALNRRNGPGDRGKALEVMEKLCMGVFAVPDGLCLLGRIYKDMFNESNHENRDYLLKSIEWYRKGFCVSPAQTFTALGCEETILESGPY